jgi:hypothetical protein
LEKRYEKYPFHSEKLYNWCSISDLDRSDNHEKHYSTFLHVNASFVALVGRRKVYEKEKNWNENYTLYCGASKS